MRRSPTIATSVLLRHVWLALAVCAVACGEPPAPPVPATGVLFIGNSYTFVNGLPQMFATLAQAGKHPIAVDVAQTAARPHTL